jgi:hypothetical protein
MTINDYKTALVSIIERTDNEALLSQWKNHIENSLEQFSQKPSDDTNEPSLSESRADKQQKKDDTDGYVIMESGLGINE